MIGWPLVCERDDGIRPSGDPGACFYCNQKIGSPHTRNCVIVTKRVLVRIVSSDGSLTGSWEHDVSYDWDSDMIEFYYNESSWCADNIFSHKKEVTWDQPNVWEILEREEDLCDILRFEFVRVVDDTPRRKIVSAERDKT